MFSEQCWSAALQAVVRVGLILLCNKKRQLAEMVVKRVVWSTVLLNVTVKQTANLSLIITMGRNSWDPP